MDDIVRLEKAGKSFGDLVVLNQVDLSISQGDRIAILGPSGAGKSTLLHLAGLMDDLTTGELYFMEKPASHMSEEDRAKNRLDQIGFLFQFHYLLPEFTLLENIMMPLRMAKDSLADGNRRAQELMKRLGISERQNHWPHQLSGGEQQRASLARALIRSPKILFCDEPTGNLDSNNAHKMMELLGEISAEQKMAMVLVTHNEELAKNVDTSYHLNNGKLTKVDI